MRKIVEEKYREDGKPLWKEYLEGQEVSWEKWEYNDAGDLTLYFSSDGDWTKCKYDEQGRLVEELKDAGLDGDGCHPKTMYEYCEDGYTVTRFDPTVDVKSTVIDENGTAQEQWNKLLETFVYDNENRLLSYETASGFHAQFHYSVDGVLESFLVSDGSVYTWPEGYDIQVGDADELVAVGVPVAASVEETIREASERSDVAYGNDGSREFESLGR